MLLCNHKIFWHRRNELMVGIKYNTMGSAWGLANWRFYLYWFLNSFTPDAKNNPVVDILLANRALRKCGWLKLFLLYRINLGNDRSLLALGEIFMNNYFHEMKMNPTSVNHSYKRKQIANYYGFQVWSTYICRIW